jgi:hypothetical protein
LQEIIQVIHINTETGLFRVESFEKSFLPTLFEGSSRKVVDALKSRNILDDFSENQGETVQNHDSGERGLGN